jgi:hypothetical protein
MAVLASSGDVQELMNNTSINATYIESILVTVDLILTKIFEYDGTVSSDLLKEMQKFYAAHLIASTTYRTASDEKIGDAQVKYTGTWGKGFESTPYGQALLALDPTGLIARSNRISASITAIKSFD